MERETTYEAIGALRALVDNGAPTNDLYAQVSSHEGHLDRALPADVAKDDQSEFDDSGKEIIINISRSSDTATNGDEAAVELAKILENADLGPWTIGYIEGLEH